MCETLDLNVGICNAVNVASPYIFGCLNIDVLNSPSVDVVCDVHHLPFKNGAFRDVYCFHVLEHIENPAKALRELLRVARRMVELEVPHRFGMHARSACKDKSKVDFYHTCSFRTMWFHRCLKNYQHCVKVLFEFPWDLLIHVWVYKYGWQKN